MVTFELKQGSVLSDEEKRLLAEAKKCLSFMMKIPPN